MLKSSLIEILCKNISLNGLPFPSAKDLPIQGLNVPLPSRRFFTPELHLGKSHIYTGVLRNYISIVYFWDNDSTYFEFVSWLALYGRLVMKVYTKIFFLHSRNYVFLNYNEAIIRNSKFSFLIMGWRCLQVPLHRL